MAAYVVFCVERIEDADALARYRREGGPSLATHGGRFVAGPGIAATLEGAPLDNAVIIEFADVAAARAWYDSPAYRAAMPIRLAATRGYAFIVEGRV